MAPWRYLDAHHRHSVTSGAGTGLGGGVEPAGAVPGVGLTGALT
ncbi:hypothetical protein ACFY2M_38305 [Streptomyces sp. NPDC001276]